MKRNALLSGLLLVMILVTASACTAIVGSGNSATESRDISDFSAVELNGIGTLNITQGNDYAVQVTADDNILPVLTTELDGEVLRIGVEDNTTITPRTDVIFDVTMPRVERIRLSGAGGIVVTGIEQDAMEISLSGAGSMTVTDVTVDDLTLTLSGAGDMRATGQADTQNITVSGAGGFNGSELQGNDVTVTVSGVGNANVYASESLSATVSGVGNITYYGEPTEVNSNSTGIGSINPG